MKEEINYEDEVKKYLQSPTPRVEKVNKILEYIEKNNIFLLMIQFFL